MSLGGLVEREGLCNTSELGERGTMTETKEISAERLELGGMIEAFLTHHPG